MSFLVASAELFFRAALEAVDPHAAVKRALSRDGETLWVAGCAIDLRRTRRIRIVGAGKAAVPMAEAALEALKELSVSGIIIEKKGSGDGRERLSAVEIARGGHPLPDEDGARAAREMEAFLRDDPSAEDLVIALFSGGGSALLALPEDGLTLEDLRAAGEALILGGPEIGAVNAVRKHLVKLSGGRLAAAASPARVVSLILSDVVGDPLDVVASGPTVPDPTSFADALAVIHRYRLETAMPGAVLDRLRRGAAQELPETPKPGDPLFARVTNAVVGGNGHAVAAAARAAAEAGFAVDVSPTPLIGEARERGVELAARAGRLAEEATALGGGPRCALFGGETTVTVRCKEGRGGRNQELALAAALELERLGVPRAAVAALSTDGQDGPTDAAGAVVDLSTCGKIRARGIDPEEALERNDSHRALDAAGALVRTGPTRTNVADIAMVLAAR